jgi:hypothetical protein
MDNKKKLGILLIAVGFVLLVLVVYLFFFRKAPATTPATGNTTSTPAQIKPSDPLFEQAKQTESNKVYDFSTTTEAARAETLEDAKAKAKAFAERFGTFSNQANYANLKDLELFMTAKMQAWAENYIAQKSQEKYSGSYAGYTATALTATVDSSSDDTAKITVETRRTETLGTAAPREYQQKISITMVKVDNVWMTDSATWQK